MAKGGIAMTHQPTFKLTPEERPWHRRLTPVAWVLIAVVALAALACLGAGGYALTRERERPFTLAPTPTPVPTAGPTATTGPSPTPTVWWEGMITVTLSAAEGPAVNPEAAFSAWWSDQMTQDAEGHWWPPEEVVEQVKDDYQAFLDEYETLAKANDFDGALARLPRWYTGTSLRLATSTFQDVQSGERHFGYVEWEIELPLQVQDFSPDGLECTLGRSAVNGTSYQWIDGELVAAQTTPGGLYLERMQYDPLDGRWKNAETLQLIPVPGEQ
jgi:hypothetical protein